MTPFRSIRAVWLRSYAVFRKNLWYGMLTTFVEPLMYLASFGFGLAPMVGDVQVGAQSVGYRAFLLGGLLYQTILFIPFFEGAYGGFVRMYYQKVFHAIAVTPITLSEILWGEMLWCSSRAFLSVIIVLVIGVALGDFSQWGALAFLPFAAISAILFAALGMMAAGFSRTIDSLNYPQYLVIFPMFLFCGTYFPISNLPDVVRPFASVLPLSSVLSIARSFVLGFPLEWHAFLLLGVWTAGCVYVARRAMMKRLTA